MHVYSGGGGSSLLLASLALRLQDELVSQLGDVRRRMAHVHCDISPSMVNRGMPPCSSAQFAMLVAAALYSTLWFQAVQD